MKIARNVVACLLTVTALSACRQTEIPSAAVNADSIAGFYLLNEGNKGSNRCTLDYYDYQSEVYIKNVFAERNPGMAESLGDLGNDLQRYGSKLYAVVNCSNLVEVIDVATAKHIGQVSVPNCRYIVFQDGYAYVSSYAGPVDSERDSVGYVAKIDTTSLQVVATCKVGYQPEEMVITKGKLYVANSGCCREPDYEHTISVVGLESFQELGKIDVAPNLHRMELDPYGRLWVSSRGDYFDIQSMLFVIDTDGDCVIEQLEFLPCSDMTICGDSLYVLANVWSNFTQVSEVSYGIVDLTTRQIVSRSFISDGTDYQFENPYGIAVNPQTREIIITEASDYVTPGRIYCYSPEGRLKWRADTGDVPSRIVFTNKSLL